MRCPSCGNPDSKVVDSRPSEEFNSIRRRRECLKCGNRFTTYERLGDNPLIIIKSDGTSQVFDREKLYRGISIACAKRPNIPNDKKSEIIDEIEAELRNSGRNEIKSKDLGDIVLEHLKGLDDVAYIRFATACRAGEIMKGKISPEKCPLFGNRCTPDTPLGASMVSSEGACSAFYRYRTN